MDIGANMLEAGIAFTSKSIGCFVSFVGFRVLEPHVHFPDRLSPHRNFPVCKRLIRRLLSTDERASLITRIFSDPDEAEAAKRLCGDDAQSFVDVLDEVLVHWYISEERISDLISMFCFR